MESDCPFRGMWLLTTGSRQLVMNVQMAGGEMCSSGVLSVAKVTLELCTYLICCLNEECKGTLGNPFSPNQLGFNTPIVAP